MIRFAYLIAILFLTANSFAQGHFIPAFTGNGQDHMNINIVTATIGGIALESGDEIAVFDGTICCGKAILTQSIVLSDNSTFVAIAASKSDIGQSNGYTNGNEITYKFWDASKNKEFTGITTVYLNPTTGLATSTPTFTMSGTAFVKLTAGALVNQVPASNAGSAQSVKEGEVVTLDGTLSSDGDGNPLTYQWTAPSGITLSSATISNPTFIAPEVTVDTNYTLSLVVNDGIIDSPSSQVIVTVKQVNKAPVSHAGLDQSSNELTLVTLDGSTSSDPDNDALSYLWTAPYGIILSSNTASNPTFIAPEVTSDTNYSFSLVVNDGQVSSVADEVVITVKQTNKAPTANAGANQVINEGSLVTLHGTASDPENDPLTYLWVSPVGVILSSISDPNPTFTAPEVTANTDFTFSLIVNDGNTNSQISYVVITVKQVNKTPVANAGTDQAINENTLVTLDATASSDGDGNPLTYQWTAPVGITLSSTTTAKPTFTAPEVSTDTNFTFSLKVNDGIIDSPADQVVITVRQVNKTPVFTSSKTLKVNEDESFELLLEGTDQDNDPITFSIEGLPSFLKLTNKSNKSAILSGVFTGKYIGDNKLKLSLSDGVSVIQETITITVIHIDHAPYVKNQIADISVFKKSPDQVIDLKNIFFDDDAGDNLIFSILSNTNEQVVKAKISGSNLTLNFSADYAGLAEIVISAEANGKAVQLKFNVEVKIPTGINPVAEDDDFLIYPNPSKGDFHLKFNQPPKVGSWITCYTSSGKIISKTLAENKDESLNLKGYPSGVYFIKVGQNMPRTYQIVLQ